MADLGLLTVVSDKSTHISLSTEGSTVRWSSPELLDPERFNLKGCHPTKESDCYALGMVVYEVLSGQTPFGPSKPPGVTQLVLAGRRPARPQGTEGRLFTDAIWGVLELCWKAQPSERTSVGAVFQGLGGDLSSVQSASCARGDMEADSDDQSDVTAKGSRENVQTNPPQSRHDSVIGTMLPDLKPLSKLTFTYHCIPGLRGGHGETRHPTPVRSDHPTPVQGYYPTPAQSVRPNPPHNYSPIRGPTIPPNIHPPAAPSLGGSSEEAPLKKRFCCC